MKSPLPGAIVNRFPLHLHPALRPRHSESSGAEVVVFLEACPLGARCGAVDHHQLGLAQSALQAAISQTSLDDLCAEHFVAPGVSRSRQGTAEAFQQAALSCWLGVHEDLLEPIFGEPSHGFHPAFVVADQLVVGDHLTRDCLAGFVGASIPRASMVMMLCSFLDAGSVALFASIEALDINLTDGGNAPVVTSHTAVDLTDCVCAPTRDFARRQLDVVAVALERLGLER